MLIHIQKRDMFSVLGSQLPTKVLYISSFLLIFMSALSYVFEVLIYKNIRNIMINNKMLYECPLITVAELADMLHLSKSFLYHDIYKAKQKHTRPLLPHIKLGGRIFYRTSDVKDMIDKEFSKPINFF